MAVLARLIARAARQPAAVLALAGVAAALWAFVEIADEVLGGDSHAVDRAIILALRSAGDPADPLGPAWLEEMMRDFTALGSLGVLTLMVLAAAGYLMLDGKRRTAQLVVAGSAGGMLLSSALKAGFARPRPELVPHMAEVYTASFPSGHSMMAAVVYLTLGTLLMSVQPNYRIKLYLMGLAVFLAVLVGATRVYLGVHWPTDVLAGWAAGVAWALLLWWLSLRLRPQ